MERKGGRRTRGRGRGRGYRDMNNGQWTHERRSPHLSLRGKSMRRNTSQRDRKHQKHPYSIRERSRDDDIERNSRGGRDTGVDRTRSRSSREHENYRTNVRDLSFGAKINRSGSKDWVNMLSEWCKVYNDTLSMETYAPGTPQHSDASPHKWVAECTVVVAFAGQGLLYTARALSNTQTEAAEDASKKMLYTLLQFDPEKINDPRTQDQVRETFERSLMSAKIQGERKHTSSLSIEGGRGIEIGVSSDSSTTTNTAFSPHFVHREPAVTTTVVPPEDRDSSSSSRGSAHSYNIKDSRDSRTGRDKRDHRDTGDVRKVKGVREYIREGRDSRGEYRNVSEVSGHTQDTYELREQDPPPLYHKGGRDDTFLSYQGNSLSGLYPHQYPHPLHLHHQYPHYQQNQQQQQQQQQQYSGSFRGTLPSTMVSQHTDPVSDLHPTPNKLIPSIHTEEPWLIFQDSKGRRDKRDYLVVRDRYRGKSDEGHGGRSEGEGTRRKREDNSQLPYGTSSSSSTSSPFRDYRYDRKKDSAFYDSWGEHRNSSNSYKRRKKKMEGVRYSRQSTGGGERYSPSSLSSSSSSAHHSSISSSHDYRRDRNGGTMIKEKDSLDGSSGGDGSNAARLLHEVAQLKNLNFLQYQQMWVDMRRHCSRKYFYQQNPSDEDLFELTQVGENVIEASLHPPNHHFV